MKKVLSGILTVAMVLSLNATAFAAGVTPGINTDATVAGDTAIVQNKVVLTPDQKIAKAAFMATYATQWKILVDLRTQTDTALAVNKDIRIQIATSRGLTTTNNKAAVSALKATMASNTDIFAQVKTLVAQRKDLVTQLQVAKKAKDTVAIASLTTQIKAIEDQISPLKVQARTNSTTNTPIKDQVKAISVKIQALKTAIEPLRQVENTQHAKIAAEVTAKEALWVTYRSDIKSKSYADAGITFQSIIDTKTQILQDIKNNTTNLNAILAALNQV